jgi:hypothetical protein
MPYRHRRYSNSGVLSLFKKRSVTDGYGSFWAMSMTKEEIGWPDAIMWLAPCVTSDNCLANLAAGSTHNGKTERWKITCFVVL